LFNISSEQEIKMKLEIGKTYLSRKGKKTKVTSISNRESNYYPVTTMSEGGSFNTYRLDGRFSVTSECDEDLVSEYNELRELFDEPSEDETAQEQQEKPLFEVGKTYKDETDHDIKILAIDDTGGISYPIIGRNLNTKDLSLYTKTGAHNGSFNSYQDLIPPEPPLPIIIGGFYLDNNGVINDKDRTNLGNSIPNFTYGLTNTFSYKIF
jgi:hypothetical protein